MSIMWGRQGVQDRGEDWGIEGWREGGQLGEVGLCECGIIRRLQQPVVM